MIFSLSFTACSGAELPQSSGEDSIHASESKPEEETQTEPESGEDESNIDPSFPEFAEDADLSDWVGEYGFYEFFQPNINMVYTITVYKEDEAYFANIVIDGFQTMERVKAKVVGDQESVAFMFDSYLPDNLYKPYSAGDVLLSFERKDDAIYTEWEALWPVGQELKDSSSVCFTLKQDASDSQ